MSLTSPQQVRKKLVASPSIMKLRGSLCNGFWALLGNTPLGINTMVIGHWLFHFSMCRSNAVTSANDPSAVLRLQLGNLCVTDYRANGLGIGSGLGLGV